MKDTSVKSEAVVPAVARDTRMMTSDMIVWNVAAVASLIMFATIVVMEIALPAI